MSYRKKWSVNNWELKATTFQTYSIKKGLFPAADAKT